MGTIKCSTWDGSCFIYLYETELKIIISGQDFSGGVNEEERLYNIDIISQCYETYFLQ
jgi:hypothetical protein